MLGKSEEAIMPALIPVVLPILGAIGGAASAATSIYSLTQQPGGGGDAAKQAQEAAQKQALADQQAKQKAILASLPNAQEQSGGALSAPSLTDLASVIAGLPGESNTPAGKGALSAFLGTPTPGAGSSGTGSDTLVGATYGLSGSQG
jgi:hypothetical protein